MCSVISEKSPWEWHTLEPDEGFTVSAFFVGRFPDYAFAPW